MFVTCASEVWMKGFLPSQWHVPVSTLHRFLLSHLDGLDGLAPNKAQSRLQEMHQASLSQRRFLFPLLALTPSAMEGSLSGVPSGKAVEVETNVFFRLAIFKPSLCESIV